MWLGRLCTSHPASYDEDHTREPRPGHESRVAYRLAYEAALEWRNGSYTKLEAFRNRAVGLLSVAALVMTAGVAVTAGAGVTRGWLTWVGVSVAGSGLVLSFVAAIALMRPLLGPFVLKPQTLVENFGDNPARYPTDDATYEAIALFGQKECSRLSTDVKRRCLWLYMSMGGLGVTALGTVLVWVDAI